MHEAIVSGDRGAWRRRAWRRCRPRRAWNWQLPAARYQGLNQFERRQYDKAAALVEKQDYKTAAGEFEKFQAEFPDSSTALLCAVHARLLPGTVEQPHHGHQGVPGSDRLFPGERGGLRRGLVPHRPRAPGQRRHAQGRQGLPHPGRRSPLQGPTLDRGGHPQTGRRLLVPAAVRRRREVLETGGRQLSGAKRRRGERSPPTTSFPGTSRTATTPVTRRGWSTTGIEKTPPPASGSCERAYSVAWNGFRSDWEKYAAASEKERIEKDNLKAEDMQAFYQYLQSQPRVVRKAGDAWGYHEHGVAVPHLPVGRPGIARSGGQRRRGADQANQGQDRRRRQACPPGGFPQPAGAVRRGRDTCWI